ncbi:MAG: MerR family transcriptional regulator [Gemmatimonadetes bacterium]|nr:MerR family transcriptional regulator [Gemmatimonadota bacterium]
MNEREQDERTAALHPIGVVARRTGLSLHVLRAWQRRYGAVVPVRTEGGQRLYSDLDVQRLRLLRQVTDAGRSISQVAQLGVDELSALSAADADGAGPQPRGDDHSAAILDACLGAAERMDAGVLNGSLMRAAVSLRPGEFLGDVVIPLLHEVGERWHAGSLGAAQEHVVSEAVRRALWWVMEAYVDQDGGPVLVATTPEGEQHELGVMAASVVALEEGWRVMYLGASLPASEIAHTALRVDASVIALSLVNDELMDAVAVEVAGLCDALPAGAVVLVGGRAAAADRARLERAGARVVTDLEALREVLHGIAPGVGVLPRVGA